jgi:hypothetical protein
MRFKLTILLALAFFIIFRQVIADGLDELSPQWQHKQLEPVIQVDLSPLKPLEQKAIEQARAKVDALLQSATSDTKQLATLYGKLGNQYLSHNL